MEPMDDDTALRPGARLDRYELLCPIASGGMASVWLARLRGKRGFEKLVAIKTIRTELVDDERFEAMFLDEARIASGIQHPNVAQIIDLGEQNEILYLVMEWVDGDSLAMVRRTAQKRGHAVPLGVALRVMADASAGRHAAHELKDGRGQLLGVVHRDVSPQNIMIGSSGVVKVIDFGVAKAKNRGAGETRTGVVKGKIHYMAPEQAQGREVDRRVDVWAIGVCLHELVTGKLPFDSDSDVDVLRRLMGTESPPRITGATIPEAIDEILSHSLVRDPSERFATAATMQRALEAAIDKLGLRSTSEDVADFVRAHVPDLAAKRQSVVTAALLDADSRPSARRHEPDHAGGRRDRVRTDGHVRPLGAAPRTARSRHGGAREAQDARRRRAASQRRVESDARIGGALDGRPRPRRRTAKARVGLGRAPLQRRGRRVVGARARRRREGARMARRDLRSAQHARDPHRGARREPSRAERAGEHRSRRAERRPERRGDTVVVPSRCRNARGRRRASQAPLADVHPLRRAGASSALRRRKRHDGGPRAERFTHRRAAGPRGRQPVRLTASSDGRQAPHP